MGGREREKRETQKICSREISRERIHTDVPGDKNNEGP